MMLETKRGHDHASWRIFGPIWHSEVRVMLADGSADLAAIREAIAPLAGMDATAAARALLTVDGITNTNGRWMLAESEAE